MSNSTFFIEEISGFKVGDMEFLDIVKSEDVSEPQDENQKIEKLKESHLLLKKKLSLSHELIKQYNDKIKECQEVSTELETSKDKINKLTQKNNSSISKIIHLEFENEERRKKIEEFSTTITEQETKIAADQQHLQQLICKVEELERKAIMTGKTIKKQESLQEKIKTLETELKLAKDSHKTEIKQLEIKLKSIKTSDVVAKQTKKKEAPVSCDKSTSTDNDPGPETTERGVMTDEFYSTTDDPYPLFCAKCTIKLDPVPVDKILSQMSACPTLITGVPSPLKKSGIDESRSETSKIDSAGDDLNDSNASFCTARRQSDVSRTDFERLEQKLSSLERKLRKETKRQDQLRNPCCGFQYPNNCYLGPYPSLFQPGTMMRSQSELFAFQSWQQGLKSRKRMRKMSQQKTNLHATKSRKKRKLEDGTSDWSVDTVQSKEFMNSDYSNIPDNAFELWVEPLRAESSPRSKDRLAKRHNENETSPTSRRRKQDKLDPLFSCARSPSYAEEELCSKRQNLSFNEGEAIENGNRTPDNEIVEYFSKKRKGSDKKQRKISTKNSLVTKIRNLKKNLNNNKPLPTKTISVIIDTRQTLGNQISEAKVPIATFGIKSDNAQPTRNNENSEEIRDYCAVKKHRIAHSARKTENNFFDEENKNFEEVTKAGNDDNTYDKQSEAVPINEKLEETKNILNTEKIGKHFANTDLLESAKNFEIENITLEKSSSSAQECLSDENEKAIPAPTPPPLRPCIVIPTKYLDIEGVEDPKACDESEDGESVTNIGLNNERACGGETSLRILRSQSRTIKLNNEEFSKTEVSNAAENEIKGSSTLNNSIAITRSVKVECIRCSDTVTGKEYPNHELSESDINDTSISVMSDKSEDVCTEVLENEKTVTVSRKCRKGIKVETAAPDSPIRELRSRRIMLSPLDNLETKNSTKVDNEQRNKESLQLFKNIATRSDLGFGPRALLHDYFTKHTNTHKKNNHNRKKINEKLQQRKENLVLKELSKLADDEAWTKSVLTEVTERLSKFKTHTIAKCTIDYLASRVEEKEQLDRSHTPPAPLLTKTQQRILTMLVALNRTIPDLIKLVQAGIEFKLFRLGHAPDTSAIEELTRVFVALARIQKDRERVRILCCDAVYCLNLRAMPLIYVILVSWPEVFPMAGSNNDPLIRCLVNSIMTQTGDTTFPKFFALKKLLTGYYNYESDGFGGDALIKNFLTTLKEKRENGLDTAIILLAKKKGTDWTHKNIIEGSLLQMIIQKAHPSIYHAFCLLGYLMRSFPIDDKKGSVKNIIEQLCALLESGEGSMQQQEGVAAALISLYRHKQEIVAKAILNWQPSEPISESVSRQIHILFNFHQPNWWKKLMLKNSIK